jgi:sarcosine oxidase subunit beta
VLNLAHSLQDVRDSVRRVEANVLNGIDAQWVSPEEVKQICPIINISDDIRYPVLGATYQPRAGIAKHDYVAWGFARRADEAGVDVIQGCEVTGFTTDGDSVTGLNTTRGDISAGRVVLCAAGHTSVLTEMLNIPVPVQSHPLQALVSELLEPVHPTIVMSNAIHVYVSQAHKGELVMGAGVDSYNGYGQRGAFHIIERQMAAAVELFPIFARAHLLRSWGGIVDVTPDASPIVGATPYENLYLNCGWGTGGFKATPGVGWCLADTVATGELHPYIAPFSLDRFVTGALVDEHGAAAVAH